MLVCFPIGFFLPVSTPSGGPAYERSDADDALLKSVVFLGAILGQCCMGFVADAIGLNKAMVLTNTISLVGIVLWYVICRGPTFYVITQSCRVKKYSMLLT